MHRNRTWAIDPEELRTQRNRILPIDGANDGSKFSHDFTSGILPAGMQWSRATTGTYVNSAGLVVSAAINEPRFQYSNGVAQGVLFEGFTTNYLPYSKQMNGGSWATGGSATVTPSYTTGPDGVANSATRFQLSFNKGTGKTLYTSTYTTLPYTCSVWMKSNTGANQTINLLDSNGTGVSCTVTPEWQRFTAPSTSGSASLGVFQISNPSTDPLSIADISAWGAQLEPGDGASSYVPTTTPD
jgi:hypothetical protein